MKYSEALKWIETHKDIIGSIDEKGGFIVSDLLIVPTNSQNQDTFLRNYLLSRDKESETFPLKLILISFASRSAAFCRPEGNKQAPPQSRSQR